MVVVASYLKYSSMVMQVGKKYCKLQETGGRAEESYTEKLASKLQKSTDQECVAAKWHWNQAIKSFRREQSSDQELPKGTIKWSKETIKWSRASEGNNQGIKSFRREQSSDREPQEGTIQWLSTFFYWSSLLISVANASTGDIERLPHLPVG